MKGTAIEIVQLWNTHSIWFTKVVLQGSHLHATASIAYSIGMWKRHVLSLVPRLSAQLFFAPLILLREKKS